MKAKDANIILVGIIIGIVLALVGVAVFGTGMQVFGFLGTFFLNALKMLVIPLIIASLTVGVTNLGDIRRLKRTGLLTLGYYAITTAIAVAIGIIIVLVIQPGVGVDTSTATAPDFIAAAGEKGWTDILLSFVSQNISASIADPGNKQILPIIVFTLFFAGILTTIGERGKVVVQFFEGVNEVLMKMVRMVMWLAPIGVFGLVAGKFGENPQELVGSLASIGKYMAAVLIGLGIHGFIVLPTICAVLARRNPWTYIRHMSPALLTAWSTASSSATLPLTMECCEERAGIAKRPTQFVLPIGATINMDGTALYESVAAIFIAQAYGIDLHFTQVILIFVTATLAAIGAAGIPQAGLVTMLLVLSTVNLPTEGVALILTVDWFLDRFRTAINVWGDSVGAAFIHNITVEDTPPGSPAA